MSRAVYSGYVGHCLRFYSRNEKNPVFRTEVELWNWEACDKALKTYPPYKRKMLVEVYRRRDTLSDNVYAVANSSAVNQGILWNLIDELERKVAINRGLL